MVKTLTTAYPSPSEHDPVFAKYGGGYELSDFQKFAIEAVIVHGHHVLITAPTGCGKTCPAEATIRRAVELGKKVIYTTPIKALSNQKFHDFTHTTFAADSGITVGLFTGDIKTNPAADVLIMTTEIYRNTLKRAQCSADSAKFVKQWFDLDIERDLAFVIFDEAHFLNDPERGTVWEECIMSTPAHVPKILISATLGNPDTIARWIEGIDGNTKEVWIAGATKRIVPLTHATFITCAQGFFKGGVIGPDKKLKKPDAATAAFVRSETGLKTLKSADDRFDSAQFATNARLLATFKTHNHKVGRAHVLNTLARELVAGNLLPAFCFVNSKKQVFQAAHELTTPLLEDDSRIPYEIARDCETIIRRLPNWEEYVRMPEYVELVKLLEKGIGCHHAGCTAIFREMVEILYSQGKIKMLFATETCAIGLNLPAKTTVFLSIKKWDGREFRLMHAYEYSQMSGRAGRRGKDAQGLVVHCLNLYDDHTETEFRTMMSGRAQCIKSKFCVNFNLVMNLIDSGHTTTAAICAAVKNTLMQNDLDRRAAAATRDADDIRGQLVAANARIVTNLADAREYAAAQTALPRAKNSGRRAILEQIASLHAAYGEDALNRDAAVVREIYVLTTELGAIEAELRDDPLAGEIRDILAYMLKERLVEAVADDEWSIDTDRAKIAKHIHDLPCLPLSEVNLAQYQTEELIALFSMFCDVSVADELRVMTAEGCGFSPDVEDSLRWVAVRCALYEDAQGVYKWGRYDVRFDLCKYVVAWYWARDEAKCKEVLQRMERETGIYTGEFIKAVLKIVNIASEFEGVAEETEDLALLGRLRKIPEQMLKYVATNSSLYL